MFRVVAGLEYAVAGEGVLSGAVDTPDKSALYEGMGSISSCSGGFGTQWVDFSPISIYGYQYAEMLKYAIGVPTDAEGEASVCALRDASWAGSTILSRTVM